MSLLMEALRKAEEAKHKAADQEGNAAAETDGEQSPAQPPQVENESFTASQDASDQALEFTLDPPAAEAEAPAQTEPVLDQVVSEPLQLETSQDEREDQQLDTLVDLPEPPAEEFSSQPEAQEDKPRRPILLIGLLALVVVLAAGGYWYFSSLNATSSIAAPASVDLQSRGFLGEPAVEAEPAVQVAPALDEPITEATSEQLAAAAEVQSASAAEITAPDSAPIEQPLQQNSIQINRIQPVADAASGTRQLSEANALRIGGDSRGAVTAYTELLQLQPANSDALLGLAQSYQALGNRAAAEQAYQKMLLLNPRDATAHLGLVQLDPALTPASRELALVQLVDDYPVDASAVYALGNFYARQGRWSEAKAAYEEGLARTEMLRQPLQAEYFFNLAVSNEQLNNPAAAYNYYQRARSLFVASAGGGLSADLLDQRIANLEARLR